MNEISKTKSLPTLLINTLPKSGSIYIMNSLIQGLSYPKLIISGGYFPERVLSREILFESSGGFVTQDHLPATKYNLLVLEQILPRFVLHVRDPRQSLLSYVHHANKTQTEGFQQAMIRLYSLDISFFNKQFADQIDHFIELFFPIMIEWLANWIRVLDYPKSNLDVLVTTFDELKDNPRQYFERILAFFEIAPETFQFPQPPVPGQNHFRKGERDEWRHVMTLHQQSRMNSMMPSTLMDRFGWRE